MTGFGVLQKEHAKIQFSFRIFELQFKNRPK
jgi:hypothetical protein